MVRFAFGSMMIATILLSVTGSCLAQPAFLPGDELLLSNQGGNSRAPQIYVRYDGVIRVVWDRSSQVLRSDLSFDGRDDSSLAGSFLPTILPNAKDAVLLRRDWTEYYFILRDKGKVLDSTDILIRLRRWYGTGMEVQYYYESDIFRITGFLVGEKCYLVTNTIGTGTWPTPFASVDNDLVMWDIKTNSLRSLKDRNDHPWYDGRGSPLYEKFDSLGIPFENISEPRGNAFLYYRRYQKMYDEMQLQAPKYLRTVKLFDLNGDSLSSTVVLDSIDAAPIDASDGVVLGDANDFYFFHRGILLDSLYYAQPAYYNSLFVSRYSLDGMLLDPPRLLLTSVRASSEAWGRSLPYIRPAYSANYQIRRTNAGDYIMVWSANPNHGNPSVFVGLFNRNMEILSAPKRVNSDTSGYFHSPGVFMKDDTVYVSWLGGTYGNQVYFRRFTVEQITSVQPPVVSPTMMEITVSPNPVHDRLTITTSRASSHPVNFQIFNTIGLRVMEGSNIVLQAGETSRSFWVHHLQPGVYFIAARNGGSSVSVPFVRMR